MEQESVSDRLRAFIASRKMSIRSFERKCGLSNGFVKQVTSNTSAERVEQILQVFPELDRNWLLYGKGDMYYAKVEHLEEKKENTNNVGSERVGTPVYEIDATCGQNSRPLEFAEDNILGYVDLPSVSKFAKIIRANGDSMSPVVKNGDYVAIREIFDMQSIFYGQIYVVITEEYRMIKHIRKYEQDEQNYVLLRSDNEDYDDIVLEKKKILKLFIVENILSINIQL